MRNYVFLLYVANRLPLPIGTQDATLLDTRTNDLDIDGSELAPTLFDEEDGDEEENVPVENELLNLDANNLRQRAARSMPTLFPVWEGVSVGLLPNTSPQS